MSRWLLATVCRETLSVKDFRLTDEQCLPGCAQRACILEGRLEAACSVEGSSSMLALIATVICACWAGRRHTAAIVMGLYQASPGTVPADKEKQKEVYTVPWHRGYKKQAML